MNLKLISDAAITECERQHATKFNNLVGLLQAYNRALTEYPFKPTIAIVKLMGSSVNYGEPVSFQSNILRQTPVTFQNGGNSVSPSEIESALERLFTTGLADSIPVQVDCDYIYLSPEEAHAFVKHFLYIHPFADGNGRTAWILLNWLTGNLSNPIPLPDYGW